LFAIDNQTCAKRARDNFLIEDVQPVWMGHE
jgi:hypothetical protein